MYFINNLQLFWLRRTDIIWWRKTLPNPKSLETFSHALARVLSLTIISPSNVSQYGTNDSIKNCWIVFGHYRQDWVNPSHAEPTYMTIKLNPFLTGAHTWSGICEHN